jgi:hypothetical protein
VVQQHVLLPDRGEHVAVMVLHPFGHARGEGGPQQVGPVVEHQFLHIGQPIMPFLDDLVARDMELVP